MCSICETGRSMSSLPSSATSSVLHDRWMSKVAVALQKVKQATMIGHATVIHGVDTTTHHPALVMFLSPPAHRVYRGGNVRAHEGASDHQVVYIKREAGEPTNGYLPADGNTHQHMNDKCQAMLASSGAREVR
jgi:hypothetical protein